MGSAGPSTARTTWPTSIWPWSPCRAQLARGFTTICFKPAMFVRDTAELPRFYAELTEKIVHLAKG